MTKLARKKPVTRKNGVLIHEWAGWFEKRAYWFDDGGLMFLTWTKDGRKWDFDPVDTVNLEPDSVVRLRDFLATQPAKATR